MFRGIRPNSRGEITMARLRLTLAGTAAALAVAALAASGVVAQQSATPGADAAAASSSGASGASAADANRTQPVAGPRSDEPKRDDRRAFEDYADSFDIFSDNSSDRGDSMQDSDDRRSATEHENRDRAQWRARRHIGRRMLFCGPRAAERASRRLERMERITDPTDAQRPALDRLKQAAAKALETVRAACPTEPLPLTPPGRLAAAEKRLEAMLQAVRIVQPPLAEFYGSLSDEQKARFYLARRQPPSFGERLMRRFDRWRHGDEDRYDRHRDDARGRGRRDEYDDRGSGDEREGRDRRHDRRDSDRDSWPNGWRGRS
jgi:hypothetical protein